MSTRGFKLSAIFLSPASVTSVHLIEILNILGLVFELPRKVKVNSIKSRELSDAFS